jgi:hypothetical protein
VRRLAPLLLVPIVAAACGGGGKRLSHAEYVRQADAICTRYNAAVRKLPKPTSPPAIVDFADKSLTLLDGALADERKLQPPKQLDPVKTRWLAGAQVVRGDIAALREAAKKGDVNKIQTTLAKGGRDDARSNALAAQLGLSVCSKP